MFTKQKKMKTISDRVIKIMAEGLADKLRDKEDGIHDILIEKSSLYYDGFTACVMIDTTVHSWGDAYNEPQSSKSYDVQMIVFHDDEGSSVELDYNRKYLQNVLETNLGV